jgi:excisionase family DNA binding protein
MPPKPPVPPAPTRRFATIGEAAVYVRVDPKTVRRWISSGRLTGFRAGPRLIRVDLNGVCCTNG